MKLFRSFGLLAAFAVGAAGPAHALDVGVWSDEVNFTANILGELRACAGWPKGDAYRQEADRLLASLVRWNSKLDVDIADTKLFAQKVALREEVFGSGGGELMGRFCKTSLEKSVAQRRYFAGRGSKPRP